ncbi:YqgQ family protein [Weissella uvarum]|uniref:YqgQ family protein n=1 Tax=Weissella uvarum TaxID=1479233 RepID=UPI00195FBCB7|nr:YqgQ family protein [Weissella uvarum]MCM0594907.1 YqgQ family protein [Weissella uvarum]
MRTFLDVLDLLKKYDIYIHLGKRLWDIELAAIEIDNLYRAKLLSPQEYAQIKMVLNHEHEAEQQREDKKEK